MTGLYDHQGVLRFTGRDVADCQEYAELFALGVGSYSIASLEKGEGDSRGQLAEDPVAPPGGSQAYAVATPC